MSWGVYWMYYRCPTCQARFKSGADTITDAAFGRCPRCGADGLLVGESGKVIPPEDRDYEDTAD